MSRRRNPGSTFGSTFENYLEQSREIVWGFRTFAVYVADPDLLPSIPSGLLTSPGVISEIRV